MFGLNLGVFEPDFDETDKSLRWGEGRLKLTLCTEAGILVFDMGGSMLTWTHTRVSL